MDPITADRLESQLLGGEPAGSAEAVAARLLAIQAQDPRGARLAIRARSQGLTAADVDRALTEDRSIVVSWLNRGTLHLVRSEDYAWLHALTTPRLATSNATRLAQLGVTPAEADRAVDVIERSLEADGPLARDQIRQRVADAGIRVDGQALVHLLFRASLRNLIVRGPMRGAGHCFVLVRDWLPREAFEPVDRDRALAELARRYLAGHTLADERDLANWAGIALGEARAGIRSIASEIEVRNDGLLRLRDRSKGRSSDPAAAGLAASAPRDAPANPPAPKLLGPYDPLLHGWRSRRFVLGDNVSVVTTNGLFRPIALVGGRAVATWSLSGSRFELEPFEPLSSEVAQALQADARSVLTFLGRDGAAS